MRTLKRRGTPIKPLKSAAMPTAIATHCVRRSRGKVRNLRIGGKEREAGDKTRCRPQSAHCACDNAGAGRLRPPYDGVRAGVERRRCGAGLRFTGRWQFGDTGGAGKPGDMEHVWRQRKLFI